jgi:hypothetical protein
VTKAYRLLGRCSLGRETAWLQRAVESQPAGDDVRLITWLDESGAQGIWQPDHRVLTILGSATPRDNGGRARTCRLTRYPKSRKVWG